MNYSDLPDHVRKIASKHRLKTVQAFSDPAERDAWVRLLEADAFLLEAVRLRLAAWAKQGGGKAENIIGQTIGAMLAYEVDAERAMMAVQFVLHGSQGPASP